MSATLSHRIWIVPLEDQEERPYYAFRWTDPITGKMRYHTPKPWIRDAAEATQMAAAFARDLPPVKPRHRLGQVPAARETIATLIDSWERLHPNHRTAAHSAGLARQAATQLGATYPEEMTPKLVEDWRAAHPVGSDRPGAYLASILNWSAKRGVRIPDAVVDALRPLPSSEFDGELMTPEQCAATLEAARAFGPSVYALAHCLSLYGWRPAHACRLTVGSLSLERREVKLPRKNPRPGRKPKKRHPCTLFPETVELLRPLVEGRAANEPLFLGPSGQPWYLCPKGSAVGVSKWYRAHMLDSAPDCGASYAWKRYAIWRMDAGAAPWPRRLSIAEIQLFTGHETKEQVLRYLRTSERDARSLTSATAPSGVATETLQTAELALPGATDHDRKQVIVVGPWAKVGGE